MSDIFPFHLKFNEIEVQQAYRYCTVSATVGHYHYYVVGDKKITREYY